MSAPDPFDPLDLPESLARVSAPPTDEVLLDDVHEDDVEPVAMPDDLAYQKVYYISGTLPRNLRGVWPPYMIRNPPSSGFSFAFVLGKPDATRVTVFCPFTFESSVVKVEAGELLDREPEVMTAARLSDLVLTIHSQWARFQALGLQRDYDVAAAVLKKIGADVPVQLVKGGEEDRRERGGKEETDELLKPVKRDGKRGRFLEWFLADGGTRSVREAMAELSMSRSNVLSYLHVLNKDHGIGYSLVGGNAEVHLPEGCENPFDDADDDAWLD